MDALLLIANRSGEEPLILAPGLREYDGRWSPAKRQRLLVPGTYDFYLVVTANNCDATFWRLRFDYKPRKIDQIFDLRGLIDNLKLEKVPSAEASPP